MMRFILTTRHQQITRSRDFNLTRRSIYPQLRAAFFAPIMRSVQLGLFGTAIFMAVPANAQKKDSRTAVQADQPVTPAEYRKLRREIVRFLSREFRQKGVSPDLLEIVVNHMDALAYRTEQYPDEPKPLERVTIYPSVAQQYAWQDDLLEITQNYKRHFGLPDVIPPLRVPHPIVFGLPVSPPSILALQYDVARTLPTAQGYLVRNDMDVNFARSVAFKSPRSKTSLGRWANPIRIAETDTNETNKAIARALMDIKAKYPNAPIDDKSFPAKEGEVNLYMSNYTPLGFLTRCMKQSYCTTLPGFNNSKNQGFQPAVKQAQIQFYRSIYLTQPYAESRSEGHALVQLNENNNIIGAACYVNTSVYPQPDAAYAEIVYSRLKSCLEQAMGIAGT